MASSVYAVGTIIYVGLLALVGYWASRRIEGEADFLVAGRGLGPLVMIGTVCGTFWGAGIFIAGPGMAYSMGYGLLLSIVGTLVSTVLLIFVISGKLRRFAGMTIPDLLHARYYSPIIRAIGALVVAEVGIVMLAVEIYAGGTVLNAMFGWNMGVSLLVISLVYVAYTVMGGFLAVAVTDLIQSMVMLVGTLIAIPFILRATGGFSAMHARVAEMSPTHLDPLAGGFITPSLLIGWALIFGLGNLTPSLLQRFYGAKDERSAIIGAAAGAGLGWIFMYVVLFMGVAAYVLYPNLERADLAFPTLVMGVMPPIIGVVVLSAGLAALMSTSDSILFSVASALSHDLYSELMNRKANDKQRLVAARIATFLVGAVGLYLSLYVLDLVYWLQAFSNALVASGFVPVVIAAFFWPRATKEGAIASMVLGSVAAIAWQLLGVPVEVIHPVYAGVIVSVLSLIVVSLLTPAPPAHVLARFFPKRYGGAVGKATATD